MLNDNQYDDTIVEVSTEPVSSQPILAQTWSTLGAGLGSFGVHKLSACCKSALGVL